MSKAIGEAILKVTSVLRGAERRNYGIFHCANSPSVFLEQVGRVFWQGVPQFICHYFNIGTKFFELLSAVGFKLDIIANVYFLTRSR